MLLYKDFPIAQWQKSEPDTRDWLEAQSLVIGFTISIIQEYKGVEAKNKEAPPLPLTLQFRWLRTVMGLAARQDNDQISMLIKFSSTGSPFDPLQMHLLFVASTTEYTFTSLRQYASRFEALLPENYYFEKIGEKTITQLLNREGWFIYEVRKAVQLEEVGDIYSQSATHGIPGLFPPSLRLWDKDNGNSLNDWDEEEVRILTKGKVVQSWDGIEPYSLPIVGRYESSIIHWNTFLEWIGSSGSAIECTLLLTSQSIPATDKRIAKQYRYMLNHRGAEYHTQNENRSEDQEEMYDKFNQDNLVSLQIMLSSPEQTKAEIAAYQFAGEILNQGQMTVVPYEVLPLNAQKNPVSFSPLPVKLSNVPNQVLAFIQRLQYCYTLQEAVSVFQLPVSDSSGLAGVKSKPVAPFIKHYVAAPSSIDQIELGAMVKNFKPIDHTKISIPISSLTKHAGIFGQPGSGKTNTCLLFARQLQEQSVPFTVIEPSSKSEYFQSLTDMGIECQRYSFENPIYKNEEGTKTCNPQFLRFNPLVPVPGLSISEHISYVKGCFMSAFPMYGIAPLILDLLLRNFYTEVLEIPAERLHSTNFQINYRYNERDLTLLQFSRWLSHYIANDETLFASETERKEFDAVLTRRLQKLTHLGTFLGQALCPEYWVEQDNDGKQSPAFVPNEIDAIFSQNTVIELASIPEQEDKALIMAFLLTYLFETRRAQGLTSSLRHVLMIEEAHRLFAGEAIKPGNGEEQSATMDSASKSISLFIDMLKEVRAYGQGIFIIDQSPSSVTQEVLKNTNLKIMHRLPLKGDRDFLGDTMMMNAALKQYAASLDTGRAIVFAEALGSKPYLIQMDRY